MFDIFYIGKKPGLFLHERSAESIQDACNRSRTRYCWIVNYLSDYTGWDWLWEPTPWQSHQLHAWPSQHQKDSGTYLVPKSGYTDTNYHVSPLIPRISGSDSGMWEIPTGIDVESFDWTWHHNVADPPYIYQFGTQHQRTGGPRYCVPGATEIKFVEQMKVTTKRTASKIYVIDHMDGNAVNLSKNLPQSAPADVAFVRYFDNYLDTLKRIAKNTDNVYGEFVWIVSSICDYKDFDFSWHPEQWQAHMLHVFASNNQKFGDTFFMHIPTFVDRIQNCKLLEWYDCNFVPGISVPRLPMPVIHHNNDTHVEAVKTQDWSGPLALFTTTNYVQGNLVTVPLWRQSTKTIVPLSAGATSVIVPKVAVGDIKTQLYDYNNIDKSHYMLHDDPLDIVFISNGEPNADQNFDYLTRLTKNLPNRLHRVDGVIGRIASQRAAAQAAKTDWYFVVPAKLEVNDQFNWNWQPDRMQQPKHYIFHAGNPVNGLVYGHQATVAYNKKLVLETVGNGLDFTMEKAHEVVPIISGTANYAESPWVAWRTAFREVIKLQHSLPDVESEYRLKVWLTKDSGTIANGHWSHKGAEDAVEYYKEVQGDVGALMKSYDWSWLASYAFIKRGISTTE